MHNIDMAVTIVCKKRLHLLDIDIGIGEADHGQNNKDDVSHTARTDCGTCIPQSRLVRRPSK